MVDLQFKTMQYKIKTTPESIISAHRAIFNFSNSLNLNPVSKNYSERLISEIIFLYLEQHFTGQNLAYKKDLLKRYIENASILHPYQVIINKGDQRDQFYNFLCKELSITHIVQKEWEEKILNSEKIVERKRNHISGDQYLSLAINNVIQKYSDTGRDANDPLFNCLMNLAESEIPKERLEYSKNSIQSTKIPYPKTVFGLNELVQLDYINTYFVTILQNIIEYFPPARIRADYPEWREVHFLHKLGGKPIHKSGNRFELNGKIIDMKWIFSNSANNYAGRSRDHLSILVLNSNGLWDISLYQETNAPGVLSEIGYILDQFDLGKNFKYPVQKGAPTYWHPKFDMWATSCYSPERLKGLKPV